MDCISAALEPPVNVMLMPLSSTEIELTWDVSTKIHRKMPFFVANDSISDVFIM